MTALSFTCITKKEKTVRTNVTPLYSQNMLFACVLPLHQTGEDAGLCESHFSIPNMQQVVDTSFHILKEGDSCGSGSYLHATLLHSPTDSTHPGSCDACHPAPQHNPDPPPSKEGRPIISHPNISALIGTEIMAKPNEGEQLPQAVSEETPAGIKSFLTLKTMVIAVQKT